MNKKIEEKHEQTPEEIDAILWEQTKWMDDEDEEDDDDDVDVDIFTSPYEWPDDLA